MAKDRQQAGTTRERKLRRLLQKAEEAHIAAQRDLEEAQARVGKAEARLAKRMAAVLAARERLEAHAASTRPAIAEPVIAEPVVAPPPPAVDQAPATDGAAADTTAALPKRTKVKRSRRTPAPVAAMATGEDDESLGIIVP